MVKSGHDLLCHLTLKSAVSRSELINLVDFLPADTDSGKLRLTLLV